MGLEAKHKQRMVSVAPPNISHRVSRDGKHSMSGLMLEVESAMLLLSKVASKVMQDLKAQTVKAARCENPRV